MIKTKSILIVFIILLTLGIILTPSTKAKDEVTLNFTVNHVATKFEKLGEKISLFFKFGKEAKVDEYQYLLEKRLAEVSYAVNNNIDMVEPTASRYSTYIAVTTDYMLANKVSGKKDQVVATYKRHNKILTALQQKFKHDSGWWLAIQNDINLTNDSAAKLGRL